MDPERVKGLILMKDIYCSFALIILPNMIQMINMQFSQLFAQNVAFYEIYLYSSVDRNA